MRQILSFLGFGRSERLARMRRKATERIRRAYGPAFGFYPHKYRTAAVGPEGVGNVRTDVRDTIPGWSRPDFAPMYRTVRPAPYRAGWGIPV